MSVEYINVHDTKTHLSKILERVEAGERIVIARAGKPIADLVPHVATPIRFGALSGELDVPESAFVWPDDEVSAMFYGSADAARHA